MGMCVFTYVFLKPKIQMTLGNLCFLLWKYIYDVSMGIVDIYVCIFVNVLTCICVGKEYSGWDVCPELGVSCM